VAIDEKQIEEIVRGVVDNLMTTSGASAFKTASGASSANGILGKISDAIDAAKEAQPKLVQEEMPGKLREVCQDGG